MARENGPRAMVKNARGRLDDDQDHILRFSEAIDPEDPRDGPKKATRTVETYTDALRRFEDRAGGSLLELDTDEVLDTFREMKEYLGDQSLSQYQSAVKAFYRWSDGHGVDAEEIAVSTASDPAVDVDKVLTTEEFHQLREAAAGPRERAIIDLLGFTGQRLRVIQTLRVQDVKPEEGRTGRYRINESAEGLKGADKAMARRPLLGAKAAVREWLGYHPTGEPEDYLITTLPTSSRGEPGSMVAQNTVRRAVKQAAEKAGIEKPVNPHAFRHFFATVAYRDYNMAPSTIRRLLGHGPNSRIMETTYRHLGDDDIMDDAEENFPGADDGEDVDEAENPMTPPVCPTCARALDGHTKCPRCGERFGPDTDADPLEDQLGQALGTLAREDPDLAHRLIEAADMVAPGDDD